ncbi:MAG: hypothetical protein O2971_15615 [Proteobacteria bacterium]|nr:hypothetical protein [Pseudomonadota bacterium]
MKIQRLKKQGKSIRAISPETGHARNTVLKYLHFEDPPNYTPKAKRRSTLDRFRANITARVEAALSHLIELYRLPAIFYSDRHSPASGSVFLPRSYR